MTELVIRKHNEIVQKTINKFNVKQNQLMALLLGKYVDLSTDECINTTITIKEIKDVMGLSNGSKVYTSIRKAVERFGEVGSIGIFKDNKYVWMPYFTKIEITENFVEFKWNVEMKPYLLNLKNNYTQYLANDYLKLKSSYSQNLYEQLKSVQNYAEQYGKNPIIQVDDIKKALNVQDIETYKQFYRFKDLILNKAIKDINEVTDIKVSMNTLKQGVKIVALEFIIESKEQPKPKTPKTTKQRKNKPIINDTLPDYTKHNNPQMTDDEIMNILKNYK